jgi:hypothetical protein
MQIRPMGRFQPAAWLGLVAAPDSLSARTRHELRSRLGAGWRGGPAMPALLAVRRGHHGHEGAAAVPFCIQGGTSTHRKTVSDGAVLRVVEGPGKQAVLVVDIRWPRSFAREWGV